MGARDELESAPSIMEMFLSAKKLLSLQPRVENRQLRKESLKSQKDHVEHLRTLGLLLPLLIHLDGSLVATTHTLNANVNQLTLMTKKKPFSGSGPTKASNSYVTPSSMSDDLPPSIGNTIYNSDTPATLNSWGSGAVESFDVQVKTEPNTTILPIQTLQLQQPQQQQLGYDSSKLSSSTSNTTMSKQQKVKSNLTKVIMNDRSSPKSSPVASTPSITSASKFTGQGSSRSSNISTSLPNTSATSASNATSASGARTECYNCNTQKTPLWRKDPLGNTLCNACGLFQKLHGTTRPLSLKTDIIKKRNSRRIPPTSKSISGAPLGSSFPNKNGFNGGPEYSNLYGGRSNSTFYSNGGIPINSPSSYSNNNMLSSSVGGLLISHSSSRYKNVMILPKPPSSTNVLGTPRNSISIPDQQLLVSPFTACTPPSGLVIDNQQIKRKRSVEITEDTLMTSRHLSLASLNNWNSNKRGSVTSFQLNSISRKVSTSSILNLQRKNSMFGINNQSLPPTPSNMNSLNQRFSAPNGGYFDIGEDVRSFSESRIDQSELGDELSSLPDISKIPDDIDSSDFFKSYIELQQNENGNQFRTQKVEIQKNTNHVLLLTTGLKGEKQEMSDLDWLKFDI